MWRFCFICFQELPYCYRSRRCENLFQTIVGYNTHAEHDCRTLRCCRRNRVRNYLYCCDRRCCDGNSCAGSNCPCGCTNCRVQFDFLDRAFKRSRRYACVDGSAGSTASCRNSECVYQCSIAFNCNRQVGKHIAFFVARCQHHRGAGAQERTDKKRFEISLHNGLRIIEKELVN